jgi:hypothetical protein
VSRVSATSAHGSRSPSGTVSRRVVASAVGNFGVRLCYLSALAKIKKLCYTPVILR